ncbi:MAG: hypothetical protein PHH40_01845 [Candidatus Moranbacteria bacterium]|nr:hypothetical protein [Candidatus Moranbacteria bacterium]MDD3965037.1 hypothetical protein [Candidatus Moranbacteria bacterium]
MIFHFTILFWTILFSLGLVLVAINPFTPTWNWYIVSILPLLFVSFLACRRITKRISDVFLLGLLSFAVPILLSLIDSPLQRKIFVTLSAIMYYFALLGLYRLHHAPKDKTAQAFLDTATIAALFFYYTGIFGFYLNFSFPLWGLMMLYFLGTALTSYNAFSSIKYLEIKKKKVIIYSLLLGFFMCELAWVMSFWPFGYLTSGILALCFFFLLWDICFDFFRESVSLRKIVIRTITLFFLIGILLWSTPWHILV